MTHDPTPDSGDPRPWAPMPSLLSWLAAHALPVGMATVAMLVLGPEYGAGLLVPASPFLIGLAQAMVLCRRLPLWATLLWPVATALGGFLSLAFVWFMYVVVGACFGLFQTGLLAAGRLRGWFLWPLVSGVSWLLGLAAWLVVDTARKTLSDFGLPNHAVVLAVVLVPYALCTGVALRWMARRPEGGRNG